MNFIEKIRHFFVSNNQGYITDQSGIINRYLREKENWDIHLNNTKKYILQSIKNQKNTNSIAVLGSGFLLDFPLEEISKIYNKIYLFDINHPQKIVSLAKKNPKIELITIDLNFGAMNLAQKSKSFEEFCTELENIKITIDFDKYDYIVSLNILNQLDILLCDFLIEKFDIKEEETLLVRKKIQENHLNCLIKNKSCIITDYKQEDTNIKTDEKFCKNSLYCTLKGQNTEYWDWIFDTLGMYKEDHKTTLKVMATTL